MKYPRKRNIILLATISLLICGCHVTKKSAVSRPASEQAVGLKADTVKKMVTKLKPYKEVITDKAISDKGLFTVHVLEGRYFFEMPDSLLNKDILLVNRISKAAADNRPGKGMFGFAGDEINENTIRFSRGANNKLYIRRISYSEISIDSSANGMRRAVYNSNLQPIAAAFDIKAITPDSSAIVIDVTDFLNGDNDIFFFHPQAKKAYGLGALQADKSYIDSINSYPTNVEIHTIKTYVLGDATATYELNSSMVLLPAIPMQVRYADDRVGYFTNTYRDFDANPQAVEETKTIIRWRLEPREEDIERYERGELVEPKKPIIYYIDPSTPKKWVPYLIQGVNDWQNAFEKAGFKHAIYALEAPANDSTWSLEDARHNAIVYKPSTLSNAMGPQVNDPRTGEILESHINWFHNVMQLIHDWYMIQAGPNDPKARKMEFDDSLMGQLIRFVSSHEVGHTLGLMHNFGASSTIPVDSLRSKHYVEANGFCPSIMDYARFNYVAQPEDSISERGLFPRIGIYDEWAIEWGYKWMPAFKTREEEKGYMNQWIINRTSKDKRLWFGSEFVDMDPRCQSEDVGDNAMIANYYGIKNLQRVNANIIQWAKTANSDYSSLQRIQKEVVNQYKRYMMHVASNIGGIMWTPKTTEQKGPVLVFTGKEQQKAAVQFLQEQLFETPQWLLKKDIFSLVGGPGFYSISQIQDDVLGKVVSYGNVSRLLWFETNVPDKAYTFSELLDDLQTGIWKELKTVKPIDLYRRNLQKTYVQHLVVFLKTQTQLDGDASQRNDVYSIIKGHVSELIAEIDKALPKYKDEMTRFHLRDIKDRLERALYPGTGQNGSEESKTFSKNFSEYFKSINSYFNKDSINNDREFSY